MDRLSPISALNLVTIDQSPLSATSAIPSIFGSFYNTTGCRFFLTTDLDTGYGVVGEDRYHLPHIQRLRAELGDATTADARSAILERWKRKTAEAVVVRCAV